MLLKSLALIAMLFGDWPQFRGPNADGDAGDVEAPLEWSDTEDVAWKVAIPGLGWSSPVVSDDRVFLTTAVSEGSELSLRAIAIDSASGQTIWDREVRKLAEAPAIHAKNSHASPTPIVHGDVVFVHFGTHGTACLNRADGRVIWQCHELVYAPVHGSGGSPVLHDGKLAVVCDGSSSPFVAAIDAASGEIAWKTPRAIPARISHSFGTPTVTTINGRSQMLAPGPEHCAAYDLATGKELWRVRASGWSVVPQPVIAGDLVIYNHDYDNPELLAVRLGGSGDITDSHIVWRLKRGAPSTPTPVLVNGSLFFVSDTGIASCVDAATGNVHWQERLGGNFSASPVHVNGRVLFLDEAGTATWVRATSRFEPLGECKVTGRTFATPAFVEASMYLRTDEFLFRFDR